MDLKRIVPLVVSVLSHGSGLMMVSLNSPLSVVFKWGQCVFYLPSQVFQDAELKTPVQKLTIGL